MDEAEYDRRYRRRGAPVEGEDPPAPTETHSVTVDGATVSPLRITYKNSTPDELNQRMHDALRESRRVIGIINGVTMERRSGGADYAGNEQWRNLMRKCGRLRR